MRRNEPSYPYNWDEHGDYPKHNLTPTQHAIAVEFAWVMSRSEPKEVARADQEAAHIRKYLLARDIDPGDPQVWFTLLEGAKLFDSTVDNRLREKQGLPNSLAEVDYESQDAVWLILAALAPSSLREEFEF